MYDITYTINNALSKENAKAIKQEFIKIGKDNDVYEISKDGKSLRFINESIDEKIASFSKKWNLEIELSGHDDNSNYYHSKWENGELIADEWADGYGSYGNSITGEEIHPDFDDENDDNDIDDDSEDYSYIAKSETSSNEKNVNINGLNVDDDLSEVFPEDLPF